MERGLAGRRETTTAQGQVAQASLSPAAGAICQDSLAPVRAAHIGYARHA